MVVGNTQLGERAQHTFRRFTTQFCRLNFEITRQHSTDGRHGDFQALTAVRRATDYIQQTLTAHVYFRHAQFVGVRMLTTFDDFTDHYAVEAAGNGFYTVDFQTCHGDLPRQRFAVDSRVNPFA